MSPVLTIHKAGPGVTVQDLGRAGHIGAGLSAGGAADRLALLEARALLGQKSNLAALEMAGIGGDFSVSQDTRIALTGARMRAQIDGSPLQWNTSVLLHAGQKLSVGAAESGAYGYLSFGGGIKADEILGSRAAHLTAGIGRTLTAGDRLPLGDDPNTNAPPKRLRATDRFSGGTLRVMPGPQTGLYSKAVLAEFAATEFTRGTKGNRQGVRLEHDGPRFAADAQLNRVSDFIVPGDIQMTGDGTPFVLLSECQTIGGYPRIGTVIPADIGKVAQATPGARLRFQFIDTIDATRTNRSPDRILRDLTAAVEPLVRDPHDIPDLLSHQLISGVVSGEEMEE